MSKAASFLITLVLLAGGALAASAQSGGLEEARSLMREGRTSEALKRVNQYLSQNPDDAGARFLKGVALTEHGNRRDAVEVFVGLTRDFPDLPEPYNNLAVLRALDGELEAARLALLEAIRIHPSYATAHENLGDVYAKLAAVEFARAARLDAANTSVSEKLALVSGLTDPAAVVAAPAATVGGSTSQAEKDVLSMVSEWVGAWTRQDVDAYLGYYAAAFRPAHGAARDEWESLRRDRLRAPGFIKISIGSPKVRFENGSRARVQFTQSYQSDTFSDRVVKQLEVVNENDGWKISRETTVN